MLTSYALDVYDESINKDPRIVPISPPTYEKYSATLLKLLV
jgi:hypothetical protein